MVVRILLLLLAFIVLINICIITLSYIFQENLYKKYGKQMLICFCVFVFLVAVMYVTIALLGLS